jgi:protease-4
MADVAASGGYYISAPATRIYADQATITGSIGAIFLHEDLSGLLKKIGVATDVMKAGKLKDMGSPLGPLSAEARAVFAEQLRDVHEQFIKAVSEGRGMKIEQVRKLADGRIYSGTQAKVNGLVDATGGMQEALAECGRLAGIVGRPQLREYGPPGLLRWLLGGSSSRYRNQVRVTGGLLYDQAADRLVRGALQSPARPGEM